MFVDKKIVSIFDENNRGKFDFIWERSNDFEGLSIPVSQFWLLDAVLSIFEGKKSAKNGILNNKTDFLIVLSLVMVNAEEIVADAGRVNDYQQGNY